MKLADEVYVSRFAPPEEHELSDAERFELEREVMASNYLELFSSKLGQTVLKDLVSKYLTAPFAHPMSTQVEVGIREGEAKVVRRIIHLRDHAQGIKNG